MYVLFAEPRNPAAYNIHQLACEEAIEPAYLSATDEIGADFINVDEMIEHVAEDAFANGFSPEEVARALVELARIHGHQLWVAES